MKKILLTAIAAFMLVTAHAQVGSEAKDMRQRFTELNNIQDKKTLGDQLTALLKSKSEQDNLLVYYYYNSKGDEVKVEEIKKIILKKFPDGDLVFQEKLNKLQEMTDIHEKSNQFDALYLKYPNQNFGFIPYTLAHEFADIGDDVKMQYFLDIHAAGATDGKGNPIRKELIYANTATSLIQKNPDAAARYLKEGVAIAQLDLDEQSADKEVVMRSRSSYYGLLVSYINALTAGSLPESGYILAKQTLDNLKTKNDIDSRITNYVESAYLNSLVTTKRFVEALPFMEIEIKEDKASDKIKKSLQEAYLTVHGDPSGFKAYEQSLLAAQETHMKNEIAKLAINQPAHDFELKDVDGKVVKLKDLKGKVVILDFWATWCGPCKASFPAMQQAVNKYKDDKQVQFLFLHTWERGNGDATQGAKKYVVDNNYTFEVLMDLRDTQTNKSDVAAAYEVDGIPTKIIIDPKGNIRFNTSGFSANADKAVKELSTMIEFAKKG